MPRRVADPKTKSGSFPNLPMWHKTAGVFKGVMPQKGGASDGLGHNISRYRTYHIMKSKGMVADSTIKNRQRKWVRYERIYSNAMWHTDWHTMKSSRMKELNLITYPDDASRCVTGAALFNEATSFNAVAVLRQAVDRFGAPATILSDNGSCFVGRGGRKKQTGSWTPTMFERVTRP